MFEWMASGEAWIALATLTALEIVLGIDNVVLISILTGRLPEEQRAKARRIGLGLAMVMRIALLSVISWIMKLQSTLFEVFETKISGKDLIMLGGGLYLLFHATKEIHGKLEGEEQHEESGTGQASTMGRVLLSILLLDAVFSIDSVITAVGMAKHVPVMVLAVVISVIVMMIFVNKICSFVEKHPTVKMLALSFLLLIGTSLIAEGAHVHIPKGYIYFAMGFSLFVEALNLRVKGKRKPKPLTLRGPKLGSKPTEGQGS